MAPVWLPRLSAPVRPLNGPGGHKSWPNGHRRGCWPNFHGGRDASVVARLRVNSTISLCKEDVADMVDPVAVASDLEAELDAGFAALGDRTRRAIISRLARGEATVGELAEPFDLTHQAISRHIGILRRSGLIQQRIDGQRRPCRLDVERMQELVGWITEQQREWKSRLDRLERHLASLPEDRPR